MKQVLFIITIAIISSCSTTPDLTLDSGADYLPPLTQLSEGLVWKYYFHQTKSKSQHPKTDIRYRKLTLVRDNAIRIEDFNAGFQKTFHRDVIVEANKWKSVREYQIFQDNYSRYKGDTIHYKLNDNTIVDWSNKEAKLSKSRIVNNNIFEYQDIQESITNTLVEGQKATVIEGHRDVLSFPQSGTDTTHQHYDKSEVWLENIGLYSFKSTSKDWEYQWELVEIMDLIEFDKRVAKRGHRVAYIDPKNALEDNPSFETCGPIYKIYDYYNDNIAQFIGGKGSLRAWVDGKLVKEKLGQESGYLTYRFVVNCKGEAGRFVIEQADLQFQQKTFSTECRDHFLDILLQVEKWKNLTVQDVPVDAYVYITIKFKNGEIIEFLP